MGLGIRNSINKDPSHPNNVASKALQDIEQEISGFK
jgi:hypothetical protein